MNDAVAMVGLGTMSVGIGARFGWEVACIIGGAILLTIAVTGAMRK